MKKLQLTIAMEPWGDSWKVCALPKGVDRYRGSVNSPKHGETCSINKTPRAALSEVFEKLSRKLIGPKLKRKSINRGTYTEYKWVSK